MDPTAYSASTLLFQVTSNGVTLASQIVPVAPAFSFSSFIPAGSNTFDLFLSSEASTLTGGNAQNIASVTFQVAQVVPRADDLAADGPGRRTTCIPRTSAVCSTFRFLVERFDQGFTKTR
jgi:hypothetical protein